MKNGQTPKVILHRANSLSLCRRALKEGAHGIEFDVRKAEDGTLILFHDEKVAGQKVAELAPGEVFRQSTTGEGAVLQDVLKLLGGKIHLDVELKERGYEREVMDMVFRYCDPSKVIATSFWDSSVRALKHHFPSLQTGILVAKKWPNIRFTKYIPVFFPLKKLRKCGADFIAAHYLFRKIGLVQRAYKLGIPVYLWTINDQKSLAKTLLDGRVEAIITDELSLALELRRKICYPKFAKNFWP